MRNLRSSANFSWPLKECSFTAVGDYIRPLKAVDELMSLCLNSGYHPAYIIKHLEPGLNDKFGPFLTKLWNNKLDNPDKWQDISWSKSLPISEDIANSLDVYRPQLESSLEEQVITWTVDVDNKSTTVSVISGDQRIIDKASQILELMAKSTVDPEVILQIIDGSQQHVNLRLWNEGGLCMKFGCEEEVSLKWQEWLKGPRMKEIAEKMQCKFFLHKHGLTAVGTYDGLEMLRMVVEGFLVYNVDPANFMVTIAHKLSNETAKSRCKSCIRRNAWFVQDAWPMVKSSLDEHGILSDLKMADRSMTTSKTVKTKDPELFLRARILLELLGGASIPASLAIEIMNGRRQHIFMRIGHQEGGLCSRFGIKEDEHKQRLVKFMAADKDLSDLTDTTVRHVGHTVLLLGRADVVGISGRDDGLEMARTLVEGYIVHGREHACVTEHREIKKSRKRKYREVMYCLREKTGNSF
ncbi:uncharacterized protein LOC103930230 [Pyrus x bretschneideri]|uniref:uncharacterized protein LOC103930230 n=1 Tax=Pyrus x bretschneideri TaxID=225117 RepID=UPI00202EAB2F|nr:uncharacterized protein LOC103930230 [Pyrus x bretschneideri]